MAGNSELPDRYVRSHIGDIHEENVLPHLERAAGFRREAQPTGLPAQGGKSSDSGVGSFDQSDRYLDGG